MTCTPPIRTPWRAQTVRYSSESVTTLEKLLKLTEELKATGQIALADLNAVKIKLRIAALGLSRCGSGIPQGEAGSGRTHESQKRRSQVDRAARNDRRRRTQAPPPLDELTRLAVPSPGPTLFRFRLGIERAEADVRLAKANAYSDVYILWQPYTFQDNSPYGLKSQYSWALGATVPLPVYNRNQGGIARAKLNVGQSGAPATDLERQVANRC